MTRQSFTLKKFGFVITTLGYANASSDSSEVKNLKAGHKRSVDFNDIITGANNQPWQSMAMTKEMVGASTAKITYYDSKNDDRFQIPQEVVSTPGKSPTNYFEAMGLEFSSETQDKFDYTLKDLRDPKNNWYLTNVGMTSHFLDKFIQVDLSFASQTVFGLGQRNGNFQLDEGAYTMWAQSRDQSVINEGQGGVGSPGVHPFVMVQSKTSIGDYAGIYFHNSNAAAPILQFDTAASTSTFSYITTGGIVEMFIIGYGSPKFVVQQYHNIIGFPQLPPYWSLGYHQGSEGYIKADRIKAVVDEHTTKGWPLDAIWIDAVNLNANGEDFTFDTEKLFPSNSKDGYSVQAIHDKGIKLVAKGQPGLSAVDYVNQVMQMAFQEKCTIMSTVEDNQYYFQGSVSAATKLSAHTVFLDLLNPTAAKLWNRGLADLYVKFQFDGFWLSGVAFETLCDGECPKGLSPPKPTPPTLEAEAETPTGWYHHSKDQSKISTFDLPFIPYPKVNLDHNTLSLNATHSDTHIEYDIHNLNPLLAAKGTQQSLYNVFYNKRPFVSSDSSYASSGKYAVAHSVGPNDKDDWGQLSRALSEIMQMNMYGIPMTGADVCGLWGDAANQDKYAELCARWIQMHTYIPFVRQHYPAEVTVDKVTKFVPMEPYNMPSKYRTVAFNALNKRLEFTHYYYTLLFEASHKGGSVVTPSFFWSPSDPEAYKDYNSYFLGSIHVAPVMQADTTATFTSYLPKGYWVNLNTFTVVDNTKASGQHTFKTSDADQFAIAHLGEGAIIPWNDNSPPQGTTVTPYHSAQEVLKAKKVTLFAHMDQSNFAKGSIYLDSGDTPQPSWTYLNFELQAGADIGGSLKVYKTDDGFHDISFEKLFVARADPIKNVDFACLRDLTDPNNKKANAKFVVTPNYDAATDTMTFIPAGPVTLKEFDVLYFGTEGSDFNFCSPSSFQYSAGTPTTPKAGVTMTPLTQIDGFLPAMTVTEYHTTKKDAARYKYDFVYDPTTKLPRKDWPIPFENPLGLTIPAELMLTEEELETANANVGTAPPNAGNYGFDYQISTKTVVSTTDEPFTMARQFNRLSMNIYPSDLTSKDAQVWGLGEQVTDQYYLQDGIYSFWNRDNPGENYSTSSLPGKNIYGTHPFFMFKSIADEFVGVFLNNAAGIDVVIKTVSATQKELIFSMSGGTMDLFIFNDADPNKVIQKYHEVIGKPVQIADWSLGWHQCRWGYDTLQKVQDVVQGYADHRLPLDTIWNDIDYMQYYRDFTIDPTRFAGLKTWVQTNLQAKQDKHYISIVDAGVARRPDATVAYDFYTQGHTKGIFIQDANKDGEFIGKVWPNDAAFPDWSNKDTEAWWHSGLDALSFVDGIWLDMNEPSNFCNGLCYENQKASPATPANSRTMYTPGGRPLRDKTIPIDLPMNDGNLMLDWHQSFGSMEEMATRTWFQANKKRGLIIGRSTLAGVGKWSSKWLGDNWSAPESMGYSVYGVLAMNQFAIPMVGADICGFGGNTNAELCAKWHMVGATYPFSRNHNSYGSDPQEPYVFAKDMYNSTTSYMEIMKFGIQTKYALLNYYYSQYENVHQNGGALIKPLYFDFPADKEAYRDINFNYMIGDSLKVAMVTNSTTMRNSDFYFPEGTWCELLGRGECITGPKHVKMNTQDISMNHMYVPSGKALAVNFMAYSSSYFDLDSMRNLPTDIVFNGALSTDKKTWTAALSQPFMVDDQALTAPKVNSYAVSATATLATNTIVITVTPNGANGPGLTNCAGAFNGNEFLSKITFMQVGGLDMTKTYTVTTKSGSTISKVRFVNGQLEINYDRAKKICMQTVDTITIAPSA